MAVAAGAVAAAVNAIAGGERPEVRVEMIRGFHVDYLATIWRKVERCF